MNVVPLNDKILVKRLEAEEKTAGGIVLPDTAKEKPKQGKVLSTGDGKLLENGKEMRAPGESPAFLFLAFGCPRPKWSLPEARAVWVRRRRC